MPPWCLVAKYAYICIYMHTSIYINNIIYYFISKEMDVKIGAMVFKVGCKVIGICAPCRIRTYDPQIRSQMVMQFLHFFNLTFKALIVSFNLECRFLSSFA